MTFILALFYSLVFLNRFQNFFDKVDASRGIWAI